MADSMIKIKFDGLLRFHFPQAQPTCEIKAHTAANGHVMLVKVRKTGQTLFREVYCPRELQALSPLSIFIGAGANFAPINAQAERGQNYERILNLAGNLFYSRSLTVNETNYTATLRLQNGVVDGGDLDSGCYRVRKELFPQLKFNWRTANDWNDFVIQHSSLITRLNQQVARNASATLVLTPGQALRMVDKDGQDIFPPLMHGETYLIDIKYVDVEIPESLGDCSGFGHHCEALQLSAGEPVYGLFKPEFPNSGIQTLTEPGCCEICRIEP